MPLLQVAVGAQAPSTSAAAAQGPAGAPVPENPLADFPEYSEESEPVVVPMPDRWVLERGSFGR